MIILNFLLLLLILCWSINPFIKKFSSVGIKINDYLIINHIFCTFFIFIYFFYLYYYNLSNIKSLTNFNKSQFIYLLFGSFITVFSSLLLIKLLKLNNASYLISNIQPLVILFSVIIGSYFYNEKYNYYNYTGIIFIIIGIFLLNYFK